MTPLPARNVEDARASRQSKQIDEAGDFMAITLGREKRPVLEEIVAVERGLPPLSRWRQKNTGSR